MSTAIELREQLSKLLHPSQVVDDEIAFWARDRYCPEEAKSEWFTWADKEAWPWDILFKYTFGPVKGQPFTASIDTALAFINKIAPNWSAAILASATKDAYINMDANWPKMLPIKMMELFFMALIDQEEESS